MRLDKFTVKAQEAVANCQSLADEYRQQEIKPEHLLLALIDQEGGIKISWNLNEAKFIQLCRLFFQKIIFPKL